MTGKLSPPNIQSIQRILSDKATRDQEHRFKDLHYTMCNPCWIETAYRHVKSNKGSRTAGIDGVTKEKWESDLDNNLRKLAVEAQSNQFKPLPVKRRYILKETSGKRRPIGISALKDRIIQEAIRMVLDPIFEADFLQSSYGFRTGRGPKDAISNALYSMTGLKGKRYRYVIEGDIKSYFDTIDHKILVSLTERRMNDKKMANLIKKFLSSGVMEEGKWTTTNEGVPQGAIISPLLANIYLHELDKYMYINYTGLTTYEKVKRRKQGLSNHIYIRYADDAITFCNGTHQQAVEMKTEIKDFLTNNLKIELSDSKTLVTDTKDGFKFLGYEFHRTIGQKGMTIKLFIPKKSIKKIRTNIADATSPKTYYKSEVEVAKHLNSVLRGWGNYYKHAANTGKVFSDIQSYAFWKFAHWLGRKHKAKHISAILKPLNKGGRTIISGSKDNPVKVLCGLGHKGRKVEVVKLFHMSSIQDRKLKPTFKKPNPYLVKP